MADSLRMSALVPDSSLVLSACTTGVSADIRACCEDEAAPKSGESIRSVTAMRDNSN